MPVGIFRNRKRKSSDERIPEGSKIPYEVDSDDFYHKSKAGESLTGTSI